MKTMSTHLMPPKNIIIWVCAAWTADSIRSFVLKLLLSLAIAAVLFPTSAYAQDRLTFRNREYKFRFVYPSDWTIAIPRGPNVRGKINSPSTKPFANCTVTVVVGSELQIYSQAELDREIEDLNFSKNDWKEIFEQKFSNVVIYEASMIRVDNIPAQFVHYSYSYETIAGKLFLDTIHFQTFTPGRVWNMGCGAGAPSRMEANNYFKYWQTTFKAIFSSFVFEKGLY